MGTVFQKKVWEIVAAIPFGETITYGEIAKILSMKAARAIGNAVGHNPISILIPCHRVVGSGGKLTGYAGGIQKKKSLLELEGHPGHSLNP
jgi:methylated-DNA-[protein]-cysteine S-methyltransferase